MAEPDVVRVAASWGVLGEYVDGLRRRCRLDPSVAADLVRYLGGNPHQRHRPGSAPLLTVRAGHAVNLGDSGELLLADGSPLAVADRTAVAVPQGYHRFYSSGGGTPRTVVGSPDRATSPHGRAVRAGRGWGLSVQPYALRSELDWGIGDFGVLIDLARWAVDQGATVLSLGPLHASAPVLPRPASPYHPATRLFLDPLYLSMDLIEAPDGSPVAVPRPVDLPDRDKGRIDRDLVHRAKYDALRTAWAAVRDRPDGPLRDFVASSDLPVQRFAGYCALTQRHGPDWRGWPAGYHDPESAEVAGFAEEHVDEVRFHTWLQWLCERQMARLGEIIDVINDLPVGFDPGGFDGWLWQRALVPQVRIGSPPDGFAPEGHGWDSAPFSPWALRELRFAPLIAVWRANLRRGAGLHLDHAMHLARLFWIPWDRRPAEGGYVEYPFREILDLLVLESATNDCFVVTEDLGNVPAGFREQIAERGILRTIMLWFAKQQPDEWPEPAVAGISNHDHPPVAAVWTDRDPGAPVIEVDKLTANPFAQLSNRERLIALGDIPEAAEVAEALVAAHAGLGRSGAGVVLVQVLDLMSHTERPNAPTGDPALNWVVPLPMTIEELRDDRLAAEICAGLRRARHDGDPATESER